MRPTTSPTPMSKSTSWRAWMAPKFFEMPRIARTDMRGLLPRCALPRDPVGTRRASGPPGGSIRRILTSNHAGCKARFRAVSGANSLSGVVARHPSGLMGAEEAPHDPDTSATGDPTDEVRGSLWRVAGTPAAHRARPGSAPEPSPGSASVRVRCGAAERQAGKPAHHPLVGLAQLPVPEPAKRPGNDGVGNGARRGGGAGHPPRRPP